MIEMGRLDFDAIVQHIGPLGKWQFLQSFLLLLITMSGGISGVIFAFTAYNPSHRCLIPQCESMDNATFSNDFVQTDSRSCSRLVPVKPALSCQDYVSMMKNDSIEKLLEPCPRQELVFDRTVVTSSITEEFDMVCDKAFEVSWFRSLLMLGNLVASLILGVISDTFGRSKVLLFWLNSSDVLQSCQLHRIAEYHRSYYIFLRHFCWLLFSMDFLDC